MPFVTTAITLIRPVCSFFERIFISFVIFESLQDFGWKSDIPQVSPRLILFVRLHYTTSRSTGSGSEDLALPALLYFWTWFHASRLDCVTMGRGFTVCAIHFFNPRGSETGREGAADGDIFGDGTRTWCALHHLGSTCSTCMTGTIEKF
jgi:hypothetical protein